MPNNFDKIKEGDVLYHLQRGQMGNTVIKTVTAYTVKIISIDREKGYAMVSWNGNSPERYYRGRIDKLRRKKPTLVYGGFGSARIATKKDIEEAKAPGGKGIRDGRDAFYIGSYR
jgi:hypothetical protein